MASTLELSGSWHSLTGVIRGVRRRWRLRLALSGLSVVLGVALVAVVVGALMIQFFRFSPVAVTVVRAMTYVTLLACVVQYLVFPFKRRTSDSRVALYLEEHEPSLDAVVLSAVETGARGTPAFGHSSVHSPRFVDRLIDMAIARATTIGNGVRIETRNIMQSLLTIASILLVGALILGLGPEYIRTAALLLVTPRAAPAQRMFILVQPGNVNVSRNGNQAIRARLHGFDADHADLMTQRVTLHGTGPWERVPMTLARDSSAFVTSLFNLKEQTNYYIEANGVRSPVYHLTIVDLPYVKRLTLEYHYPQCTGLAPKTVADSGDISALQGTSVIVRATTTMPVTGGQIAVEGKPQIPMTRGADGVLTGTIPVRAPGLYNIALNAPNGNTLRGSLDYAIDVLKDDPPTVAFTTPGRDVNVASTDSVPTQIKATDDYGVAALNLHYSLNGGPERVVALKTGVSRTALLAGYTFDVKALGLQPNDVVSYYAQATDNDCVHGGKTVKTDIYFLNVRLPRQKKDSKNGGKQGGRGGQGGQGGQQPPDDDPGIFVLKQRQIIVGSFKIDRDQASMAADTRRENLTTLSLAQNRLRGQVEALAKKITDRGLAAGDSAFQVVADELPKAATEMKQAEETLTRKDMRSAMGPEQRAIQHLQRAEAAYRSRQQQQQQGQGQSRSGKPPEERDNDDLANMFDSKKDQVSQQYETNQTPPPPQQNAAAAATAATIDTLAQKLKRLAERQEQAKEQREQQQASMSQQQGQQNNQNQQQNQNVQETQRQLANEAQQAAKQLEQLAREHPNDKALRESAQQLQKAADAMQQAAKQGNSQQFAKALAQLQEARRLLAQSKQAGEKGDPNQQVLARARDLVRDAQSLADQVRQAGKQRLAQQSGQPQGQQPGQQPGGQQPGQQPGGQQPGQQPGGQQPGQQPGGQQPGQQPGGQQPGQQPGGQQPGQQPGGQQPGQQPGGQQPGQQPGGQQPGQQPGGQQPGQQPGGQQPGQQPGGQQPGQQPGGQQPGQQPGGQQPSGQQSSGGQGRTYDEGRPVASQLAQEYGDQQQAAEALRRDLQRQGRDTKGLEHAIDQMRALASPGTYHNGSAIQLASSVIQGLKAWEFELHKALEADTTSRPVLGGTADVPSDYQALVSDYYRSLAKKP